MLRRAMVPTAFPFTYTMYFFPYFSASLSCLKADEQFVIKSSDEQFVIKSQYTRNTNTKQTGQGYGDCDWGVFQSRDDCGWTFVGLDSKWLRVHWVNTKAAITDLVNARVSTALKWKLIWQDASARLEQQTPERRCLPTHSGKQQLRHGNIPDHIQGQKETLFCTTFVDTYMYMYIVHIRQSWLRLRF